MTGPNSLRRFIQRRGWQRRSPATVRMGERAPGEVAEMDFGRLGLIEDPETGRRRAVWALIIVLTYSRHSFVWPTFSQKLVDVIEGLEAAWALLRGRSQVPGDRQLPRSSGWCRSAPSPSHARLPGVLPAPGLHLRPGAGCAIPGTSPAWSVEWPYVRERFFKGGEFRGLSDMRSAARRWCLEVAGQRIHGTTPQAAPGSLPG